MAEQQPQPQSNGQNKKKAFLIVGLVVAIGLTSGYVYSAYRKTHVSTDDAFIEGNIHTIATRVDGSVRAVAVKDNQQVKKGDLLVELEQRSASFSLTERKPRISSRASRVF